MSNTHTHVARADEITRYQNDIAWLEALLAAFIADRTEAEQTRELDLQIAALSDELKVTMRASQAQFDELSSLSAEETIRRKHEFEQFDSTQLIAQTHALDQLLITARSRAATRGRHVRQLLQGGSLPLHNDE